MKEGRGVRREEEDAKKGEGRRVGVGVGMSLPWLAWRPPPPVPTAACALPCERESARVRKCVLCECGQRSSIFETDCSYS